MKLVGLGLGYLSGILDPQTQQVLASAIQQMEGFYPGSLAYENNNPGNLMFVGQQGAVLAPDGFFAKFPTYEDGLGALYRQLDIYAGKGYTIQQMMEKYAPKGHGANDPNAYAQFIAQTIGVSPDTKLVEIAYPAGEIPSLPEELAEEVPPVSEAGFGGGVGMALAALVGLLVLSRT